MARLSVTYTSTITEIIDWPDDEMEYLNKENLVCNLEPSEQDHTSIEISYVKIDGELIAMPER